ncbi:polysaccharide pyruvyl transferase family protein [Parvibaculaceae bacterium PLY_AMNH_Bact1]|nr:polysaccharide pyruvyl transferase family protein [Parvibaculaceae bacterium PLY_AMNH_Bact1]
MKILFPASHWASNIGNPFFTLGVKYAVEKAVPEAEVIQTAGNPILPMKLKGRARRQAFNYSEYVGDVDAVMFAGPMFDRNFRQFYEPAFKAAQEDRIPIFLVSAGGMQYDQQEINHCRAMLQQYKPHMLLTRDAPTFDAYGDLAHHSLDGICGAWFSPDYYPGYETRRVEPYCTSVFDFRPEPRSETLADALEEQPQLSGRAYSNSRIRARIGRTLDRGGPSLVSKHLIVRPCHRPANHPLTIFTKPNTFAAYTPYGYLNLYRNTKVTITDRLHAAVVTLAYGNPAYLFLRSKRSHLLAAVGVEYAPGKRLELDQAYLASRRENVIHFLGKAISASCATGGHNL